MDLHDASFVFDLHVHGTEFVPQPVWAAWRAVSRAPTALGFEALRAGGVNAVVAKAVGDPLVTRWHRGRSPWQAVEAQLALIERQAEAAGAVLAGSVDQILVARERDAPAVLLGIEGADAIGRDVDGIDAWYERGVRMIILVHLADNTLGTTCLPWQRYAGPLPVRRTAEPGLTPFGARVVERMNERGMLVDVAHCDEATLRGVVDVSTAPVVSSHTGARALQDFPRYLSDVELRAIAGTGGVIGLWPYRNRRSGVRDIEDLIAHARHIAEVVGPQHLALGTDLNGMPGQMADFAGAPDLPKITTALLEAGFTTSEVQGILGENALRVFRLLEARAH